MADPSAMAAALYPECIDKCDKYYCEVDTGEGPSYGGVLVDFYHFSGKEKKQKASDEEIVRRALAAVGEGGYNVFTNNCEHFANYCVFGKKSSDQIDEIYRNVTEMLKKRNAPKN